MNVDIDYDFRHNLIYIKKKLINTIDRLVLCASICELDYGVKRSMNISIYKRIIMIERMAFDTSSMIDREIRLCEEYLWNIFFCETSNV